MIRGLKKNRFFILLLLTGAVYFFLKWIVPLLAPVLLSMIFVTIFGPLLQKMQTKLRIHRQIGAIIILLVACAILGILVWILLSWIIGSLPGWISNLDNLENNLSFLMHQLCEFIGNVIPIDKTYLEDTLFYYIQEGLNLFQLQYVPGMLSHSLEYVRTMLSIGGFLVIFVIATVLIAKDYDDIMNRMLDREDCHLILEIVCGIIRYLATFVKAQIIIMSSIGALSALVLAVSRIPQGALWGLLAGVLDALPFVGTGIVLIPLGIQQFLAARYTGMIVCLLLYFACILIREFLEPKLIGRSVGIPPIAILVSVYAGVRLFGIWGIVEGPLGFVIVKQAFISLVNRYDINEKHDEKHDENREKA